MTAIAGWTGLKEFEAAIARAIEGVNVGAREAVKEAAAKLERTAKQNAPVVTGTLRRGIKTNPIRPFGHGWQTEVGPTIIYSRRVELGFNGADSAGRIYAQRGHAYFTPAYERVVVEFAEIFQRNLTAAIVKG